jgi:hypothetical protein
MINQQILDYIKQQTLLGVSNEQIRSSLIANGWNSQDIDLAFSSVSSPIIQRASTPLQTVAVSNLPSALSIFGQSFDIYSKRFGTIFGVMVAPVLIAEIITMMFLSDFDSFESGGMLIALRILLILILIISQIWGYAALLYAIKDGEQGIGVLESYRRGLNKIHSIFWVAFLIGFIYSGGLLLFIVPGIIFLVWFSLAPFILISEDTKGMDALLKSKEYIKGKWWSVFGRFLFFGLVYVLFYLTFYRIANSILTHITNFTDFAMNLFNGLVYYPLVFIYTFLIYKNLRTLKGDIVFSATRSEKAKFIILSILGFILLPFLFFSFGSILLLFY